MRKTKRRNFIKTSLASTAGLISPSILVMSSEAKRDPLFKISLAQWSLHRTFFGKSLSRGWGPFSEALKKSPRSVLQGEYDPLEFPRLARQEFDISGIEYVNTFFFDRAQNQAYLSEMKKRADAEGVTRLLIMCDAEGNLGTADAEARQQAVQNHRRWFEAAAFLGCHSIRVNAAGDGSREDQQRQMAESLFQLGEYAKPYGLNVLVENHGGLSSDGAWLAGVMKAANHPRVGSLPDFGNFQISEQQSYDRYQGVQELLPFARAVSAKAKTFDSEGEESDTDYHRMLQLVVDAGYRGYIGIEYEGQETPEWEGIRKTKLLLERVRAELAPRYVARD